MNPITSTHGRITVVPNTEGTHYVLGPVRLPEFRDRSLMDELHRQRLTRDPKVAKQWADDTEAVLMEQHG